MQTTDQPTTPTLGDLFPAELKESANAGISQADLDAREARRRAAGEALLRDQRKRDNRTRWELCCPPALQRTDWEHPDLAGSRSQIDRVLGYQLGARGIVASGPTGKGKSRALWELMRRLALEGYDVRFYAASDWFSQLQDFLRYGRDDARGWVETVARRHIVFLDDYGQQAMQRSREDWAQAWFFHFLEVRVGAGLPLFMTTNLRSAEMAERNGGVRGDPLVRRLLDVANPISFWK